jgi:apolipoprotein N-acyltransferase
LSKSDLKDILFRLRFFAASALMLTLIQAPFDSAYLAWLALVPFILACSPDTPKWRLVWTSYIVSLCYWLGNLYWIGYVTIPAYILFCMYLALYWPILALCLRHFQKNTKLPLFIVTVLLFLGAEAWQGIIFTGFNWRLLGQSQYTNLQLIQIADIFGELGVSFLVALVNGLVAELLLHARQRKLFRSANAIKITLVAGFVISAIIYGNWRITQIENFLEQGPMVASVQPNVPSLIKESPDSAESTVAELIERSNHCFRAGAKLVAWPETMVPASLNSDYLLMLHNPQDKPKEFDRMIAQHSKNKGYVLVGAHSVNVGLENLEPVIHDQFNSAFLYETSGRQSPKRYDKIHLVLFGEYIPFKKSWPWFYNLILSLSPYDYDYNLTKGDEYTRFITESDDKNYGFGVLICYEDTDATVTRKMVLPEPNGTKADWLVNISNDGWYVRYKDGKVLPSVELSQRTAISVFRAIENRISILRSVNTGISCLIDPLGRIKDGFIAGDLPQKTMERQGVAGWFVDKVAIDRRLTFFTKNGQWFKTGCATVMIIVIMFALGDTFGKHKSRGNSK